MEAFDLIICVPFPLSSRVLSPTRFFLPTPFPLSHIQTNTSLSQKKKKKKKKETNSVQKTMTKLLNISLLF
ncbi:hypothetical protein VNO80_05188 [Phaseolus coccineus]|uniref:Uncharacterized protein n=1 Tax=Phaseolus coccineus TaxID=3886 RepID=A0AAN9RHR1_PHACN